jgi:hypothetical protein
MSKSLRLSEKWFNRGLWLITLVFASFLIGLGNVIVGDLPQVDGEIVREDFIEKPAVTPLRAERDATNAREATARPPSNRRNSRHKPGPRPIAAAAKPSIIGLPRAPPRRRQARMPNWLPAPAGSTG